MVTLMALTYLIKLIRTDPKFVLPRVKQEYYYTTYRLIVRRSFEVHRYTRCVRCYLFRHRISHHTTRYTLIIAKRPRSDIRRIGRTRLKILLENHLKQILQTAHNRAIYEWGETY